MNSEKTKTIIQGSLKWIFICVLIGFLSGSASAILLVALEWAAQYRGQNNWIIWLLPIGGLLIGLGYHYYGKEAVKGNNLLLEEYETPKKRIPLIMAPLVLIGTIITHLFGGSAGREGTAVQMGGAIADQFTGLFKLDNSERKTLIILGIYTVEFWAVKHTHYSIPIVPPFTLTILLWIIPISILFGLAAMLFSRSTHFWSTLFSKTIKYPPLRPFVGGILFASVMYFIGTTKYLGLGVPIIVESFSNPSEYYDFLLKILFTGFTLGAGFKGGEVTPLFFIGATLGSALSIFVPLPIALLAGMGFVAVFSGATHTPIACTIMGMELFGIESGLFIGLGCFIAYLASGPVGIYHSQIVKGPKHLLYQKFKRRRLDNF
jgi:H+/Cl- antiporter ClcA